MGKLSRILADALWQSPKEKKERIRKTIFEEMMAQNFLNLMKHRSRQIQEAQQISRWINSEIHSRIHYNQTVKCQRERVNPESCKKKQLTMDR